MSSLETQQDREIAGVAGSLPFVITSTVRTPKTAATDPGLAVESYIRDIVGGSFSADDPTGAVSALTRSFSIVETEDGLKLVKYTPYGGAVTPDQATLSGVQGALHRRFIDSAEEVRQLIEGIAPMSVVVDVETAEASGVILEELFERAVDEIGSEGGPSALSMDALFAQILGFAPDTDPNVDPEQVGGALGDFRDQHQISRDRINTAPEEENYTKYLSLFDYLVSLYVSWTHQRPYFQGQQPPYFGTQLVHLKRVLQAIVEGVDEATSALDDVNIGAGDRALLKIHLADGSDVYLASTLTDIREYCAVEANDIVSRAGRNGAISLYATLWMMAEIAEDFVPNRSGSRPPGFPSLYYTPLVRAAMASLAISLDIATQIVADFGPPQPVLELMPIERRQRGLAELLEPETAPEPIQEEEEPIVVRHVHTIRPVVVLGFHPRVANNQIGLRSGGSGAPVTIGQDEQVELEFADDPAGVTYRSFAIDEAKVHKPQEFEIVHRRARGARWQPSGQQIVLGL